MFCNPGQNQEDDDWSKGSFVFTPGSVYAGNLCAAEHMVMHEGNHMGGSCMQPHVTHGSGPAVALIINTAHM